MITHDAGRGWGTYVKEVGRNLCQEKRERGTEHIMLREEGKEIVPGGGGGGMGN